MTLADKKELVLAQMAKIKNSQERFAYIVQHGRRFASLPECLKTDAYRVNGCLAKLWFVPDYRDGKCYFQVDSDSAIVKGIATVLCDFYSGHTPEEIATLHPSFFEKVGIDQHLTPNRRNSLSRIWENISGFAAGHRQELAA